MHEEGTKRSPGLKGYCLRNLPIAALAWIASAAVFFRQSIFSGFDRVPGDRLDGRLIIYLHEHLFRWLLGYAQLRSPAFYYPQRDVLGYSDAFLLDAVPYTTLRLIGLDPYLSITAMFVVLSGMCFLSCFVIFRKYLKVSTFCRCVEQR